MISDDPTAKTEPRVGAVAAAAAQHYLANNQRAATYLLERGITPESIRDWQLGWWCYEAERVATLSCGEEEVRELGLTSRLYNRITLPLLDPAGRPLGLVGRQLGDQQGVKWLYPEDNKYYVSSSHLIGLHQILTNETYWPPCPLLVEGPFDVILCHQASFPALSPHHASFTADQAALLRSLNRSELILVPDADSAGENMIKSAKKHRRLLPELVKVARLPDGEDPASLITKDPNVFAAYVAQASPLE